MSSQGRRKHSACLYRISENCPFRKLRRNMCNVPTGGQWRSCETPPQAEPSVSNCGINRAADVETFSRPPQSASHLQEPFSAMDTDMDPQTGSSYSVSDNPGPSDSLINHQCRLSSSNTIINLDSRVDPETGERANVMSLGKQCRQIQYMW